MVTRHAANTTHTRVLQKIPHGRIPCNIGWRTLNRERIESRSQHAHIARARCSDLPPEAMSREPALEVREYPVTRHHPQVRRVTHTPRAVPAPALCVFFAWDPARVVHASRARAMFVCRVLVAR
jgi:hypothetical protein